MKKSIIALAVMAIFGLATTSCSHRVTTTSSQTRYYEGEQIVKHGEWRNCTTCKGKGSCNSCNGTGKISGNQCKTCKGTGRCQTCKGQGGYEVD